MIGAHHLPAAMASSTRSMSEPPGSSGAMKPSRVTAPRTTAAAMTARLDGASPGIGGSGRTGRIEGEFQQLVVGIVAPLHLADRAHLQVQFAGAGQEGGLPAIPDHRQAALPG